MLSDQTKLEIMEVLASQLSLEIDDITEDSDIVGTLGADSLDIVELVTAYEDKYNIEVPDSAVMKIKHVIDIFDYVEKNTNIR
ncbi:MAG: acyl carrier protein [Clostridia bacterium]|nr:acyl carrier protein [Clostridia bacterium]